MEHWYSFKNWGDEEHQQFYQHYREADAETQEKAILHQASLLSKHLDNTTLKAAESLLILWLSKHFNPKKAAEVYQLMSTICSRIGDHHRAKEFQEKLKNL